MKTEKELMKKLNRGITHCIAAAAITLSTGTALAHDHIMKMDCWPKQQRAATMPRHTGRTSPSAADELSWQDASRDARTPREASELVASHVSYTSDVSRDDEWKSGQDTWQTRQGDCEDFAAAVSELCTANDMEADIYVVKSDSSRAAHAVAVGETDGMVWVSSNGSYATYSSLNDARQALARDLGWSLNDTEIIKAETL